MKIIPGNQNIDARNPPTKRPLIPKSGRTNGPKRSIIPITNNIKPKTFKTPILKINKPLDLKNTRFIQNNEWIKYFNISKYLSENNRGKR